MNKPLRLVLIAALAIAAAVLLVSGFDRGRKEPDQEEPPIASPPRVSTSPSGETVIALDTDTQARIGLKAEALPGRSVPVEFVAYGALQEDPSRSFVVRAPVAGTLRRAAGGDWPSLGETLKAGQVVGRIEPRLAPVDRVNLRERLASAQADVDSLSASLGASRAAYQRTKALNAEDKNVSDRAVQEAEARLKSDEARLQAARETVALMHSSLNADGQSPVGMLPLVAETGGQVVEVPAHPDEAIESGQAVLRLSRFDQLLAKVDLPAGHAVALPVSNARIVVIGHEDQPLTGVAVAVGAAVDPKTQGQSLLFRIRDAGPSLRPGMAVTAYLAERGAPRSGVILPRSSIVRFAGAAWAYVQTAPGRFTRRRIALEYVTRGGWFTTSLRGGESIVVVGAQTLLSEELRSQIQVGEASEAR